MDAEDRRTEPPTGPSDVAVGDQPSAAEGVPASPPAEGLIDSPATSVEPQDEPVAAPGSSSPEDELSQATATPPSDEGSIRAVPSLGASLAAIQFKADGADLPSAPATPAPAVIICRVGDLPIGLLMSAAAVTLGLGLVLVGALLPTSQSGGKTPLLAIESVSNGATPAASYGFGLAAIIAGFLGQLIAYPMLARRGRRLVWVLLLLVIGVAETAVFAVARSSGGSISGEPLTALPPMLGIAGGVLTAVAGLALGLVGTARDGVKCRECRAVLTRETGFCPDCGAWLTEAIPTRSTLARGWHSGFVRGALSVVAVALPVAVTVLLVVATAPRA